MNTLTGTTVDERPTGQATTQKHPRNDHAATPALARRFCELSRPAVERGRRADGEETPEPKREAECRKGADPVSPARAWYDSNANRYRFQGLSDTLRCPRSACIGAEATWNLGRRPRPPDFSMPPLSLFPPHHQRM